MSFSLDEWKNRAPVCGVSCPCIGPRDQVDQTTIVDGDCYLRQHALEIAGAVEEAQALEQERRNVLEEKLAEVEAKKPEQAKDKAGRKRYGDFAAVVAKASRLQWRTKLSPDEAALVASVVQEFVPEPEPEPEPPAPPEPTPEPPADPEPGPPA